MIYALKIPLNSTNSDSLGNKYYLRIPINVESSEISVHHIETIKLSFPDDLVDKSSLRLIEMQNNSYSEIPFRIKQAGSKNLIEFYESGYIKDVELEFVLSLQPFTNTSFYLFVAPVEMASPDYKSYHEKMITRVSPYIDINTGPIFATFTNKGVYLKDSDGVPISDGDAFQERKIALFARDLSTSTGITDLELVSEATELGVSVKGELTFFTISFGREFLFYDGIPVFELKDYFDIPVLKTRVCVIVLDSFEHKDRQWTLSMFPSNDSIIIDGTSRYTDFFGRLYPLSDGTTILAKSGDFNLVRILKEMPPFDVKYSWTKGKLIIGKKDGTYDNFGDYHGFFYTNLDKNTYMANQCNDVSGKGTFHQIFIYENGNLEDQYIRDMRNAYLKSHLEPVTGYKQQFFRNRTWVDEPGNCGEPCLYNAQCKSHLCENGYCVDKNQCVKNNTCYSEHTIIQSHVCIAGEWKLHQSCGGPCEFNSECKNGNLCINNNCRQNYTICVRNERCYETGYVYSSEYCENGLFLKRKIGGMECTASYQCETGFICENGFCKKEIGAYCESNEECITDHCFGNVCCAQGKHCCRTDSDCTKSQTCSSEKFYCEVLCGNNECDNLECSECPKDCVITDCLNDKVCSPDVGENCDTSSDCKCSFEVLTQFDTTKEYTVGEPFVIIAEVRNTGEAAATYDITLKIDKIGLEEFKTIKVGQNSMNFVEFSVDPSVSAKNLKINISAQKSFGSFEIKENIKLLKEIRDKSLFDNPLFMVLFEFKELFEIIFALVTVLSVIWGIRRFVLKNPDNQQQMYQDYYASWSGYAEYPYNDYYSQGYYNYNYDYINYYAQYGSVMDQQAEQTALLEETSEQVDDTSSDKEQSTEIVGQKEIQQEKSPALLTSNANDAQDKPEVDINKEETNTNASTPIVTPVEGDMTPNETDLSGEPIDLTPPEKNEESIEKKNIESQ